MPQSKWWHPMWKPFMSQITHFYDNISQCQSMVFVYVSTLRKRGLKCGVPWPHPMISEWEGPGICILQAFQMTFKAASLLCGLCVFEGFCMRNARGMPKVASQDEWGWRRWRWCPARPLKSTAWTREMPAQSLEITASRCLCTTPMPLVSEIIPFIST